MIKRFIRRVFGLDAPGPQRVPQSRHGVTRNAISHSARKVCDVLAERGYSAYVVGGAVRDVLLGIEPKDFDVATDARPEQIKPLFRRALLIGRRFRLVHVMLGPETLEVSTFRAADAKTAEKNEHGRVLRDNVFGTVEEDARRRDFTVNALSRGPGAHAARRAAGREARPDHRQLDARADQAPRAPARARAAAAPVRGNAQAAALGPRQRLPAPAAQRRPAQGPAAPARRDPRPAAGRALRHAGAGADRRTRAG